MCVPSTPSADGGAPGLGAAHTNETDEDEKKEVNLTTTGEAANQTSGNISSSQAGEDICGDAEPAVARPEEVAITGSEPNTSSSALQRRIATKQRRRLLKDRCGNAQSASREVYRLHNLVQYDHNVDEEYNCPELNELALMRRQLTQLALLASLQQESPEVRLEDLRTLAERKSDYAYFGPHDPEGMAAQAGVQFNQDAAVLRAAPELVCDRGDEWRRDLFRVEGETDVQGAGDLLVDAAVRGPDGGLGGGVVAAVGGGGVISGSGGGRVGSGGGGSAVRSAGAGVIHRSRGGSGCAVLSGECSGAGTADSMFFVFHWVFVGQGRRKGGGGSDL